MVEFDEHIETAYNHHYDSLCGSSESDHPMHGLLVEYMATRPTLARGFDGHNALMLDLSDPDNSRHQQYGSSCSILFRQALKDYSEAVIDGENEAAWDAMYGER
tara:strand:+ start:277 stop:588 length:312 start_codon:yes stop_codon:yes gene_type:complete